MTGRYTTSGHLTSLGIRVGVGVGPVKAELFCFGFSHSHHWWRRMEVLTTAVCISAHLECGISPYAEGGRDSSSGKRSHPLVCEEQGLMGDLLSGCRAKEGCWRVMSVIEGGRDDCRGELGDGVLKVRLPLIIGQFFFIKM